MHLHSEPHLLFTECRRYLWLWSKNNSLNPGRIKGLWFDAQRQMEERLWGTLEPSRTDTLHILH